MSVLDQLPSFLEPFRNKILATQRTTVRIQPQASAPAQPAQSRFGGQPYHPLGQSYPLSAQGRPLFFLAQLNFSEIPPLVGFPTAGLLQFFIADNDLYGLDPGKPTVAADFQVRYFPTILPPAALETNFSFLPLFEDHLPFNHPLGYALSFQTAAEWLGPPEGQFYHQYPDDWWAPLGADQEDAQEFFYDLGSRASGHKIGGYAFFTQEDPRPSQEEWELLLQIDSDSDLGIVWGDMGIANFFIRPADLAAHRFDQVWYNWDCS